MLELEKLTETPAIDMLDLAVAIMEVSCGGKTPG